MQPFSLSSEVSKTRPPTLTHTQTQTQRMPPQEYNQGEQPRAAMKKHVIRARASLVPWRRGTNTYHAETADTRLPLEASERQTDKHAPLPRTGVLQSRLCSYKNNPHTKKEIQTAPHPRVRNAFLPFIPQHQVPRTSQHTSAAESSFSTTYNIVKTSCCPYCC